MYKRVSIQERESIGKQLAQKQSLREIAKELKRSPSTISREISRLSQNTHTYSASRFRCRCMPQTKTRAQGKRKIKELLKKLIDYFLGKRWSPEQISCYLKANLSDPSMRISHESIYQYIYFQVGHKGKELRSHLRRRKKVRGRRNSAQEKRGKIKNAVSIHERPKDIKERKVVGHWEGDLIIGKDHIDSHWHLS